MHQDKFGKKLLSLWLIIYIYLFLATSQFSFPLPFLEQFTVWLGKTFLKLSDLHKIIGTGSGDTTYDYVLILVILIFSLLFSLVILIIDRKRESYRQLYLFTIVVVRYYVAFTMVVYGLSKIFDGQFPANSYGRLDEKVGDMSPMGMVWSFMGASRAYTFTSGLLEFTGGMLLFFRKTKTVGALFSMGVMMNVALLNYMYDVPVKIFSTHIVLLCVFMLSYEWKKLYNFFILHRTEQLDYNKLHVKKKWMQVSLRVVKVLFILGSMVFTMTELWSTLQKENVPMEGAYHVNTFILKNDTLPVAANKNDSVGWSNMYIQYPGNISIKYNSGARVWKNAGIDTVKKIFRLTNYDSTAFALLSYTTQNDTITFTGTIQKDSAKIISTRKLKKDYSLTSRGYHWINEYPPNW